MVALECLAGGLAHGDPSAYNVLVRDGRLVPIDLPQVVDVVANPGGARFLARDVRTLAGWFTARVLDIDAEEGARHLGKLAGFR